MPMGVKCGFAMGGAVLGSGTSPPMARIARLRLTHRTCRSDFVLGEWGLDLRGGFASEVELQGDQELFWWVAFFGWLAKAATAGVNVALAASAMNTSEKVRTPLSSAGIHENASMHCLTACTYASPAGFERRK